MRGTLYAGGSRARPVIRPRFQPQPLAHDFPADFLNLPFVFTKIFEILLAHVNRCRSISYVA